MLPVLNWKADGPSSFKVSSVVCCQVKAREALPPTSHGRASAALLGRPLCCAVTSSRDHLSPNCPQTVFLLGLFSLARSLPHWAHPSTVFSKPSCRELLWIRSPDFPSLVSLPLCLLWVGQLGVAARCGGPQVRGLDVRVALPPPRWETLATLFDLFELEFPNLRL